MHRWRTGAAQWGGVVQAEDELGVHPLLTLPSGLTDIGTGYRAVFNAPITLPPMLRKFSMGVSFNQPMSLPATLTELEMGENFSQPIDPKLPAGLSVLRIGNAFMHPLVFPDSLTYVVCPAGYPYPPPSRTGRQVFILEVD